MSDHERPPEDLTEGWPEEQGNRELAEFAGRLRAAVPEPTEESLARVRRAMGRELDRRRRVARWFGGALAAAAVVLLAAGVWRLARQDGPGEGPTPAAGVTDVFTVVPVRPPAPEPPRGLVRLEDYRSLFESVR